MLHDGQRGVVVDPGQAQPVLDALQREGLQLQAILVTHHHGDHVGGIDALRSSTGAAVYGPTNEPIPGPCEPAVDSTVVTALGLPWQVLAVPGHTAGHLAYFCDAVPGMAPVLFCGDTLFSGGCGRLFEGTPAQMLASLGRLAALPGDTQVCSAHEYTLSNLKFARAVEPNNAELLSYQTRCEQLRQQGRPTLPASLAIERQVNPFLRTAHPDVVAAVRQHAPAANDAVSDFAALREWKNQF